MNFNIATYLTLGTLFFTSVAYAIGLNWWQAHYPESFDDLTWLQVVIGVGFVLLGLLAMLDLLPWLRTTTAFAVASLPIIARSVINYSRRRRQTNGYFEQRGGNRE